MVPSIPVSATSVAMPIDSVFAMLSMAIGDIKEVFNITDQVVPSVFVFNAMAVVLLMPLLDQESS